MLLSGCYGVYCVKNVHIHLFIMELASMCDEEKKTKLIFTRVDFPNPTKVSGNLRVVLHLNS